MNVKPHRKGMETMAENSKASLYKKLLAVQKAASVGKNRYNDYSDYYYRTLGDLFAAIKPTLMEQNAVIYIEDEIVLIGTDTICDKNGNVTRTGEKAYVKATVHFIDCETGEEVTTSAYARECRHNNMSDDQSSGSASSYARKYAINAMFLFDEGADADSQNNQNRNSAPKNNKATTLRGAVKTTATEKRPPPKFLLFLMMYRFLNRHHSTQATDSQQTFRATISMHSGSLGETEPLKAHLPSTKMICRRSPTRRHSTEETEQHNRKRA